MAAVELVWILKLSSDKVHRDVLAGDLIILTQLNTLLPYEVLTHKVLTCVLKVSFK